MSIQICTVSGTVRDTSGNPLSGVTIKAYCDRPFIHPTDSSLIMNYEVNTTSASDGTWSLNLIDTTTPNLSLTVSFYYPLALNQTFERKDFTIIVPNAASATFASLASATAVTQV